MVCKITKLRRISTMTFAGGLLLTAAACGHSSSLMDSVYAHPQTGDSPTETPVPAGSDASRPEAVMTPFPYKSVNDAPWHEIFNDSNKYQYPFAEKLGIRPIEDIGQAYFVSRPIVKIQNNASYTVDTLTHSLPYLVPKAASLLDEIGKGFIANLKRRGVNGYRIKVTSLLRTPSSVKQLRRTNINATDSSAHKFATTFDISYIGFSESPGATPTSAEILKNALAETLFQCRREEKCMVKYERKTCCFHITVTR